ncbi:transporter membrane subunit [Streptomyces nigrescens]|uniref:Transporter membrane subunit n=2 Tax=Streptomyces TaxID=1883 RepID=A0ABM7ZYT2_STRNI|nr:cytosine permease [Streptomyces nigrescens]MEE4422738.1 cytosine permease [Streptomyces sp. DSM 41528]BDM71538.1 transporter membrane subunit [Streptomyces nigrescens]
MDPTAPMDRTSQGRGSGMIEVRSIDYVPVRERHGKVWHQGPFWFTGNFVLTTMVTGFLGPSLGLSLAASVAAVVLGACFGTFFMAFHANQGPRMGLPQMIQSRAQFGIRGAIVPFAAVVFVYVGFNVFNVVLAAQGLRTVFPGGTTLWYVLIIGVAIVLAVVGHDLLHLVQRWLTYVLIAVFGVLTVGALVQLHPHTAAGAAHGSWTSFLVVFSAAAGYQISYAVYVSDYSRYLPRDVSARKVIWWTYAGAGGSAAWLMSLGALLASALPHPDAISALRQVGNAILPGFGTFAVVVSSVALIGIMAVNAYGAMLTTTSAVDAFRTVKPTVRVRIAGIVTIGLIIFAVAMLLPEDYLESFNTFVLMMLYFLIPWTAVNLVDFYWVRRGHYAVTAIFDPAGLYGRWAWRGILAYAAGFVAMIPFFATSFYTGPVTEALGGADLSFVPGLLVGGGLYHLLNRNLDLAAEQAAVAASERELEGTPDAAAGPDAPAAAGSPA